MIADAVRGAANNERSAQIRQIKLLYLDNTSDFCMVMEYLIGATSHGALLQMRIAGTLTSEFTKIEDVRTTLFSPSMYTYPRLFDLFCAALESGRFRGTNALEISPIENLITVPHEAHFRLELWYALTAQSFRHDTARSAGVERHVKHNALCVLVAQDRRENASAAFEHRSTNMATTGANSNSSSESEDGVDSEFY